VAKLPNPPARLDPPPEPITIPEGSLLWRLYRAGGRHPMTWNGFRSYGPIATARFDHQEPPPHEDPSRAIYYASNTAEGAIVETYQDTRVVDRLDGEPWLAAFELASNFIALDLTGAWPTRAGASQAIASGQRNVARAWSRLIWSQYGDIDWIWYPSAMSGNTRNLAAFERGRRMLPDYPVLNVPLSHPGLLADLNRIAARYGYGLR
jgi:RES domain-containing protein